MKQFVLLGDSVFDNAAYVEPHTAVLDHLNQSLPQGWSPLLKARDGSVIADVKNQVEELDGTSAFIALSVGGNDALQVSHLLETPVTCVASALAVLHAAQAAFQERYDELLHQLAVVECPVSVCTIYNAPLFDTDEENKAVVPAISLFNDVITRSARRHGFSVIELRDIFTEKADFAPVSPIEPSAQGGRKLAERLAAVCKSLP